MNKEPPRIAVGSYPYGGKSVALMQEIIREVKKLDNTSVSNRIIAEAYNKKLEQLSGGAINVRIWVMGELLHCTVIYPNKQMKELLEW